MRAKVEQSVAPTAFVVMVIAVGVLLRILGARGELWLDEVWAISVSKSLASPAELFSLRLRDGHFSLYTLYLSLLPSDPSVWIVRLPTLLSAPLTLALFHLLVRRVSPASGLVPLCLFAVSYPLVLYGSEARGYAPMLMAALAALLFLHRYVESGEVKLLPLFWSAAIVAALCHLSAIPYLLGWSVLGVCSRIGVRRAFIAYAPLCLGLLFFYLGYLRGLAPGSGPLQARFDIIVDTLSVALGGPLTSATSLAATVGALAVALFAGAAFVRALRNLGPNQLPLRLLLLTTIAMVPLAVIFILNPKIIVPRYFLLSMVGLQLVTGIFIERLMTSGRPSRYFAAALLLLAFLGHGIKDFQLSAWGRGGYRSVLQFLQAQPRNGPGQPQLVISSDNDFRHTMMLSYFAEEFPQLNHRYVSVSEIASADWYLAHSLLPYWIGDEKLTVDNVVFHRRICSSSAPLSGWGLCLYGRVS